jgi:hypothetical protein
MDDELGGGNILKTLSHLRRRILANSFGFPYNALHVPN